MNYQAMMLQACLFQLFASRYAMQLLWPATLTQLLLFRISTFTAFGGTLGGLHIFIT